MNLINRFWVFAFASLAGLLLAIAGMAAYIWFQLPPGPAKAIAVLFREQGYVLLGFILVLSGMFWIVYNLVYTGYVRPVKKISAEADMIYSSNPCLRIKVSGNREIKTLARVINDFADLFENLNKTITQQILTARKETERERNMLAAIMGELPQGVIICNTGGRILLYNSIARNIFTRVMDSGKTERFMGLGRSVYHLMDKDLITHAMDEIQEQLNSGESNAGACFITPISEQCLVSVDAIPVMDSNRQQTGVILAFREISKDIKTYETIKQLLSGFKANLAGQDRLAADFCLLSDTIKDTFLSRLPLSRLDPQRFMFHVQKIMGYDHNIRINVLNNVKEVRIIADNYSLTRAFVFLFNTLARMTGQVEFDLAASRDRERIRFDITWKNALLPAKELDSIRHLRVNTLPGFDDVLKLNKIWFEIVNTLEDQSSHLYLSVRGSKEPALPVVRRIPVMDSNRPEFYDFDLFQAESADSSLLDTRLTRISCTVFDTETTGLDPDGGDEIISIGAVRIVNNRIMFRDIFEELVNPRRDIPMESYRIHGISHEMVADKDGIEKILPRFQKFAADTVLVGHNIAFDMKMFKLKEKKTRVSFTNPVLDTLLLSAVLHPVHARHDMESVAQRLGVEIIGRHTALGDAVSTAEIFLKLVRILNSNGILTLKDAITASKKSYYARLKY